MLRVRLLPRVACALVAATIATLTIGGAGPAGAEEQTTIDVLRIVDGGYVVETVTAPARSAETVADDLEAEADVVVASPSVRYDVDGSPDPYWDQDGPGEASDVRSVWPRTRGEGQIVAVLDTGVDTTHPDLAGALVPGTDTVGGGGDPWHGTGVAGVVAARADNGIGGAGMAPQALTNGGINLWRMPMSEQDDGFGSPLLVRPLSTGGFSYDRSWTLAGAVGDVTGSDDGTPDQIIWHAGANGGALLWAVGGGPNTTPRLWFDLRSGGWSWAQSVPMLGDVTGDGWEDLVVRHATAAGDSVIWVFPSDGERLGAPQQWGRAPGLDQRGLLADLDADGRDDLVIARATSSAGSGLTYDVRRVNAGGTAFSPTSSQVFTGFPSAGWSYASSRQVAGDLTGDGRTDLVTVHAGANRGLLVWVHRNCTTSGGQLCFEAPTRWQDMRTGGWSYTGSRQVVVDTDGDGDDDLVTLHSSGASPGLLIWRHESDTTALLAPELVIDMRGGGWNYALSRADVG